MSYSVKPWRCATLNHTLQTVRSDFCLVFLISCSLLTLYLHVLYYCVIFVVWNVWCKWNTCSNLHVFNYWLSHCFVDYITNYMHCKIELMQKQTRRSVMFCKDEIFWNFNIFFYNWRKNNCVHNKKLNIECAPRNNLRWKNI